MKAIILGNSLVRDFRFQDIKVISISGLNWEKAMLTMMDRRVEFKGATVYIVVGPLRFTSMHRSRGEVAFIDKQTSTVTQIFQPLFTELKFLHITPIICPVFPMDFEQYNTNRCREPIMSSFYQEWNARIIGHSVIENRSILEFNERHGKKGGVPMIHNALFKRKINNWTFKVNRTTDGLHLTVEAKEIWAKEFLRIINVKKFQ